MNEATDVRGDGGCVHMLLGPRQTTPCAVHDLVRPGPTSGAPLRASKWSPAFLARRAAAGRGGKRLGRLEDVARQICAACCATATRCARGGSIPFALVVPGRCSSRAAQPMLTRKAAAVERLFHRRS